MNIEKIKSLNSVKFTSKGEEFDLQLTDEFKIGLEILENTNKSMFLTGKAGTGKSTLLNYFVSETDKIVAVLAFTGLAAINVGGETIHSFFKLPLGFIETHKIKKNPKITEKVKNLEVIVIDEISMVRADMIDAIDRSLRIHKDETKPFGGIQMVFMGDLHQLPPIIDNGLKRIYFNKYKTPFFFSGDVFITYSLPYLNLVKIFRQKDENFIKALNSVRERNRDLYNSLELINENVLKDKRKLVKEMIKGETVCITTTNKKSKEINDYFLSKLDTEVHKYKAKIIGDFDEKSYPTDKTLELRVGGKVMLLRNNKDAGYVNGDVGIITYLDENHVVVKKNGNEVVIEKADWEKYKYEINEDGTFERKKVGSFIQFPLKLAWSITIHKCIEENQKVKTINGWKPISKINIGDKVLTHKMTYKSVIDKIDSGKQEVFELKTKFGNRIIATDKHPIISNNNWVKIKDLKIGDYVTTILEKNKIENIEEDNISYLLGYLIGDGSYTGSVKKDRNRVEIVINSKDSDYISNLKKILSEENIEYKFDSKIKNRRNNVRIRFQNKEFRKKLYDLGLTYNKSYDKDIPEKIFEGTLSQKASFIKGLFDSDGSVDKNHIRLVNTSHKLLHNIQLLLIEFGIGSGITEVKDSEFTKHKAYVLRIITKDNNRYLKYIGFNGSRKNKLLNELVSKIKKMDKSQFYVMNKSDNIINLIKENKLIKKTNINNCNEINLNKLDKIITKCKKNNIKYDSILDNYKNYQYRDDKIIFIKSLGYKKTYDIEVEDNHSFISESFICHNSQGQSYNRVFIDFGDGTFTSGQAYVALSRCRSLEGLMLNQEIAIVDVKLDDSIKDFYDMFENIMNQ